MKPAYNPYGLPKYVYPSSNKRDRSSSNIPMMYYTPPKPLDTEIQYVPIKNLTINNVQIDDSKKKYFELDEK